MKKLTLTLCAAIFTLGIFAADVKVDATGAVAGSHTTIQAAINAAANGDRIVIFSGGVIYNESVTINKALTLLCAAEEEYYFVDGDITITPANGREITIVGAHLSGNILSGATNPVGARCVVNIVDSKILEGITFSHEGFDVNVLYNEITGKVELKHGKVIANKIGLQNSDVQPIGEVKITSENVSYGTGDTVMIIANRIIKGDHGYVYNPLSFDNVNARYFIANNSIRSGVNSSSNNYFTAVKIVSCLLTDSANVFINNYVVGYESNLSTCTIASTYALVELKGIRTDNLVNNIFHNRSGTTIYGGCALLGGLRGDYNYYRSYKFFDAGNVNDNNINSNTSPAPDIDYDLVTGKVTSGEHGVNRGKPGVAYMDIDLTRNDLGTYGGPYTQENYWDATSPQGGRARVFLLQMPSNIYSLTAPTIIKANSTHTK